MLTYIVYACKFQKSEFHIFENARRIEKIKRNLDQWPNVIGISICVSYASKCDEYHSSYCVPGKIGSAERTHLHGRK